MQLKKILAVSAALIMSMSLFSACDANDIIVEKSSESSENHTTESTQDETIESKETAPSKILDALETSSNEESSKKEALEEESSEEKTENDNTTQSNQVLYEDANIKITYVGIEEGVLGTEMKLLLENYSNKSVTVQTRETSVNGVMVDPIFSSDIAPGKKTNDSISFYSLEDEGIDEIGTVELSFHIFDSDTWETIIDTDPVTVVVNESAGITQKEGTVVYDENGVKISYVGKESGALGCDFNFVIENNMGKTITVQTRDVSVDGFMYDPIFSADVKSGTIANHSLSFWEDDFPETQNEIELTFHIFDADTWETIVDTSPITINVSE